MLKQGTERFAVGITLLSIVLLFSAGCDKYTKYKISTFFFTGVPSIDGSATLLGQNLEAETEEELIVEQKNMISASHGPFDAKQCNLCHVPKDITQQRQTYGGMPGLGELPKELLMPIQELCVDCHVTKSSESAAARGLWLHGPVSTGMCTTCHHHHRSVFPYMLNDESDVLCRQCHVGGSIIETEEHLTEQGCIECHNAHLGKNRYLLRKDYLEVY